MNAVSKWPRWQDFLANCNAPGHFAPRERGQRRACQHISTDTLLQGGFCKGLYRGLPKGVVKGDARILDYGSCGDVPQKLTGNVRWKKNTKPLWSPVLGFHV